MRLLAAYLVKIDNRNIFVKFDRRRCHKTPPPPIIHIKLYTSNGNPSKTSFLWDTDGIPFIVDNSATDIISNVHKLFIGPFTPTKVTLETSEGLTIKIKFAGTMRLALMENANVHHTYDIPDCFLI